jgi:threonine synthase
MVKQAFADNDLQNSYRLTSANSINVARWLPQQLYYFFAAQQWPLEDPPVVSVPSGNFGNLCAGMLAQKSGLRLGKFIAACNRNDTIPEFFRTGSMPSKKAVATLSNAMDVALPSNFVRIMEMYEQDLPKLKNAMEAISVDDADTLATMRRCLALYQYLTDPHGAVALHALEQHLYSNLGQSGIFLGTAHPIKFPDAVGQVSESEIPVPESIRHLWSKQRNRILMSPHYSELKHWMLSR